MEACKELFVKAFMEAERLDNQKMPNEEEIKWEFSEKFERSMNKLIKKNDRIQLSTRRNIKKGLLAAIIAIIVLFNGLMSVSATITPFIEFIKKIFPKYNEITISEESTPPVNTIETEYTLTALPQGYVLDTYQSDEYSVFAIWKNDRGEEISFSQRLLDSSFTIDNEHYYEEFEINGHKAYYVEDAYGAVLKWEDGYYWLTISVPASNINDIKTLQQKISEKN